MSSSAPAPLHTNLARRLALRQTDQFIIDPIFPNGAIHVISGPPDAGKTTWTLQMLYDWQRGKAVLGTCKSNPCEWVYISLDRSTRDTDRTLQRLGLSDWDMPCYSIEEIMPRNTAGKIDLDPSIFDLLKKFPNAKLFVIEGLQGYLPNTGRGQSLNKAQMLWVMKLRDEMLNRGLTIIAVTHTPKSSDAAHDREDMLGSQGLIGGLGTVIKFGMPPDPLTGKAQGMLGSKQTNARLVTIMPKNSPPMYLTYSRGGNGSFELDAVSTTSPEPPHVQAGMVYETPGDNGRVLDMHLTAFEGQAEITRRQVMAWGREANINPEYTTRWINSQIEAGRLVREGRDAFRRTTGVN